MVPLVRLRLRPLALGEVACVQQDVERQLLELFPRRAQALLVELVVRRVLPCRESRPIVRAVDPQWHTV